MRKFTTNSITKVKCKPFLNILNEYGNPYYVKIDIEGADTLCLKDLLNYQQKPEYVSIEAGLTSFDETFTELSLLWNLGYRSFKIVNQSMNKKVKCPNPALEGIFTDYQFDGTCSGPFGEESPGDWMSLEETFVRYRRLLAEQKYFGATGKMYKSIFHRVYEVFKGERVGWYDFHAKLGS
jgi:hypothetical protein